MSSHTCRSLVRAATLVGVLSSAVALAQAPSLYPGRQFKGGPFPSDVEVGDLNGDGTPDLVVTNGGDTFMVSVLLGDGDAGFPSPAGFPVGEDPGDVVVADLNGDGNLDVVVANHGSDDLSVLLGDGRGALMAATTYGVGHLPNAVDAGDLDGDGAIDLALVSFPDELTILLGNGRGGFGPPASTTVGSKPEDVLIDDLNADGRMDVVVANGEMDGLWVLLGDGQGGLAPAIELLAGYGVSRIATGDVNEDGNQDLAVVNNSADAVSILQATGDGAFELVVDLPIINGPSAVGLGDLDADGHLDVIATGNEELVYLFHGQGDGSFSAPTSTHAGYSVGSFQVSDLDGDGVPDVAVLAEAEVSILRGLGAGAFDGPQAYPVGTWALDVGSTDVNEDGVLDLVVVVPGGFRVGVGDGEGGFSITPLIPTAGSGSGHRLGIGDLNQDSHSDVAITFGGGLAPGTVALFLGDGRGGFSQLADVPVGILPYPVLLEDLDGDGLDDLIVGNVISDTLTIGRGDGAGGFSQWWSISALNPGALAVSDLNLDGLSDLVTVNTSSLSGGVYVYLGIDHQPFGLGSPTSMGAGAVEVQAVAVDDLNLDGFPDIACAHNFGVSVFLANGAGGFLPLTEYVTGKTAYDVAIRDLDADGRLDLVVANYLAGNFSFLHGDGAGGFANPVSFLAGSQPRSLAVADFDGDAKPDVAVGNFDSGDVTVSLNRWVWADLAQALPGQAGPPRLVGQGSLEAGTSGSLTLEQAAPGAPALLLVSSSSTPAPFKGGVLVPVPWILQVLVGVSGSGAIALGWAGWPAGISSGASLYFQYAVLDGTAPQGIALSNALRADVP